MIVAKDCVSVDYVNLYSLTNKMIGIPIFQRFYDWSKPQTEQLLSDILSMTYDMGKELYLLDFIYYIDEESGRYMLADGQQRVVTINLLIKAINDYISSNNLDIKKLKLFNIKYDIQANDEKYDCNFNNYICKPFKSIYLHFYNWVDTNSGVLDKIVDVIEKKIYVYLKKCVNADDAFVIFQQINTGGKPLSKDEIIQTAIKQYSESYGIQINAKVKDLKLAIMSYYKYLTGDTSKNFDNIAVLSFLKTSVTKDKSTFQAFVNTLNTLSTLEKNPITSVFCYIKRTTLYDVLNVLAMKGIDTTTNDVYLEKVIMPLCMLSIVLSLTGGLPSILKSLMNEVIKDINEDKSPDEISLRIATYINSNSSSCKMDFDAFTYEIGGLGKKNNIPGIRKGLLVLDIIDHNKSGTVNIKKVNLEHIYPQTPKTAWAANGWPTDDEEKKRIINNIGNQFLLCESVNKSISNNYISLKVQKYDSIIAKDKILQTDINYVDFKRFENEKEIYIIERQKKIAESIYNNEHFFGKVLFVKKAADN